MSYKNMDSIVFKKQVFCLKTGFVEVIDLCLNLGVRFCITWLVLQNYKKISPQKPILN